VVVGRCRAWRTAWAARRTHVTGLRSGRAVSISRWYYRQAHGGPTIAAHANGRWCILVDPGCLDPWKARALRASVQRCDRGSRPPAACGRTRLRVSWAPAADRANDRAGTQTLFVAGAGWTQAQADGRRTPRGGPI